MSKAVLKRQSFSKVIIGLEKKGEVVEFPSVKEGGAKLSRKAESRVYLDKRAQNKLILEFRERGQKIARSIFKKWHAKFDLQEIDSLVDLSLCEAVVRFDPKREVGFLTFFYYHLKGNLIRAVSDAKNKNTTYLSDIFANEISDLEQRVKFLNAIEIAEATTSQAGPEPYDVLIAKELRKVRDSACSKLSKLERTIIERVCIEEDCVNEVAKNLGYSRCHLSRVKTKALAILQAEFENYLFEK